MTDETTPTIGEKLESKPQPPLYCSFCGKSQHEVRRLIGGPGVFICDECNELCRSIIEDEEFDGKTDDEKFAARIENLIACGQPDDLTQRSDYYLEQLAKMIEVCSHLIKKAMNKKLPEPPPPKTAPEADPPLAPGA